MDKYNMNEYKAQLILKRSSFKSIFLRNCKVFGNNESDFIKIDYFRYVHEIEIKLSLSDLKLEKYSKAKKHIELLKGNTANTFSYALPYDLAKEALDSIPQEYGVYGLHHTSATVLRKPTRLHDRPVAPDIFWRCFYNLANKTVPILWKEQEVIDGKIYSYI